MMMDLWLFWESDHFQWWDLIQERLYLQENRLEIEWELSNNLIIPPFIIEDYNALYLYTSCPILIGSLIECVL